MANQQRKQDVLTVPTNMPGGDTRVPFKVWLREETIDHLFPWGGSFFKQKRGIQAASIGLAVVVTVVWILAATGQVAESVVIGWWSGWSVYEVLCRRKCKPWVKVGPWWGRKRRPATTPDIIFYVATKNLLIGAFLFLILAFLGVLGNA